MLYLILACPSNMFACGSTTCLPELYRCNRKIDCASGDDEIGCRKL